MIRRPPRSTLDRSSAASDVYKRQALQGSPFHDGEAPGVVVDDGAGVVVDAEVVDRHLSLIHISEPTRPY